MTPTSKTSKSHETKHAVSVESISNDSNIKDAIIIDPKLTPVSLGYDNKIAKSLKNEESVEKRIDRHIESAKKQVFKDSHKKQIHASSQRKTKPSVKNANSPLEVKSGEKLKSRLFSIEDVHEKSGSRNKQERVKRIKNDISTQQSKKSSLQNKQEPQTRSKSNISIQQSKKSNAQNKQETAKRIKSDFSTQQLEKTNPVNKQDPIKRVKSYSSSQHSEKSSSRNKQESVKKIKNNISIQQSEKASPRNKQEPIKRVKSYSSTQQSEKSSPINKPEPVKRIENNISTQQTEDLELLGACCSGKYKQDDDEECVSNRTNKRPLSVDSLQSSERTYTSKTLKFSADEEFPNLNLLVRKKRKDWNFNDPDLIRALYVESETNLVSQWKAHNAIIKSNTSQFFRHNRSSRLRHDHLLLKKQKERKQRLKLDGLLKLDRSVRDFRVVHTLTNATTLLRHSFCRNHPSVPRHVIEHYLHHHKPPFKVVHGSRIRPYL